MKNHPNITLGLILAVSVAVGAFQGYRVDRLFEAQAFLRWMSAAAANERLSLEEDAEEDAERFDDKVLYEEIAAATEEKLSGMLGDTPPEEGQAALTTAFEQTSLDDEVYALAKGSELAPLREQFLEKLRGGRLEFTQELSYAAVMSGLEGKGSVSIFNLFFGFRKVAANFIWLQVDRYWHAGLLHRMIPLMKTCVLLDPNFIDAYLLGSWHLGYNVTAQLNYTPYPLRTWSEKYRKCLGEQETYYYIAVDFLKDGIRNNPRNYKLYFDLGFSLYREKLDDSENAVKYLGQAVRLDHERWVPRMYAICLQENGQYEESMAVWKEYLKRFEGHDASLRFIQRLEGLIAERKAQQAKDEARNVSDPVEREKLMAEYRAWTAEAYAVWEDLDEPYGVARKLRLDAIAKAEAGQYLEAFSLLDQARFEVGSLFEEFSDLIIEVKLAGDIPLSLTESKQLLREEESVTCIGMPEEERQRRIQELEESRKPVLL